MISKPTGRITGWISYNIGRAKRRFISESLLKSYPANHERIHELNALVTYDISHRWSVSGTMVLASGTPFTSVNQLYLYAEHIISHYNEHNSSRLKPYFRIDLSCTYKVKCRGHSEQGLNVSVYNVLGRENELFQSWKINAQNEFHQIDNLIL